MINLKICGLRRMEDVEIVNKYRPTYVGFVFAKSKRQISLEEAKVLKSKLLGEIQAVGVFVNESIGKICAYEKARVIDCIQLHGDEDSQYIRQLKAQVKLPIIKAIRVKSKEQLTQQLEEMAWCPIDYYLFDSHTANVYGGSGESFEWSVIKSLVGDQIQKPYFLAGGIGSDNLQQVIEEKPYAIDISSKLETNGFKDEAKIEDVYRILQIARL